MAAYYDSYVTDVTSTHVLVSLVFLYYCTRATWRSSAGGGRCPLTVTLLQSFVRASATATRLNADPVTVTLPVRHVAAVPGCRKQLFPLLDRAAVALHSRHVDTGLPKSSDAGVSFEKTAASIAISFPGPPFSPITLVCRRTEFAQTVITRGDEE